MDASNVDNLLKALNVLVKSHENYVTELKVTNLVLPDCTETIKSLVKELEALKVAIDLNVSHNDIRGNCPECGHGSSKGEDWYGGWHKSDCIFHVPYEDEDE